VALVASGALCTRLAILAVLIAAGVAGIPRFEFQLIAFALAVTSAVQVIVDSSTAGAFTIINWDRYEATGKSLWAGVLRLQALAALFVILGTTTIVGAVAHSREGLLVGAAVGAAAMAENIARFARCRYQRAFEFRHFAAVDLTLGAARLGGAVTLIAWGVDAFLAAQVFSVLIGLTWVAVSRREASRDCPLPAAGTRETLADLWPYSAGAAVSSVYSQVPTIVVGAVGGLGAGAVYGIATRVTQPTELLPAALSSVRLPFLVDTALKPRRALVRLQLRLAVVSGVIVALAVILSAPIVAGLFRHEPSMTRVVIATLALALPLKFANYQLVAIAISCGRAKARLAAAARVGVFSLALTVPASVVDVRLVPAVVVASEALLLLQLRKVQRGSTALSPRMVEA
jgi:O-antigen/teichoic acid export membrane protein